MKMSIRVSAAFVLVAVALTCVANAAAPGRYKKQGVACVWDANDNGPDQCSPINVGRFKRNGNTCVWAGNEKGTDDCTPTKGRFKKDGRNCNWDANDNGPNQCDPRAAK